MALGVYFHPAKLNRQQYDQSISALEKAGHGSPPGRMYHACFGEGDNLMVFEIWDTQENFAKFGTVLMPILAQVPIDPGQPDVMPIQNIIVGK
ncbi:MAG TPA: hypothetical protein VI759_04550 [Dehalococcoidia bacterium]|nr:hypothetical protein [Dehalococcoidia bacterium]